MTTITMNFDFSGLTAPKGVKLVDICENIEKRAKSYYCDTQVTANLLKRKVEILFSVETGRCLSLGTAIDLQSIVCTEFAKNSCPIRLTSGHMY